ncbi:MAG: excinuclease ABC subunit UvrC [Pseudomonadota bacterium]
METLDTEHEEKTVAAKRPVLDTAEDALSWTASGEESDTANLTGAALIEAYVKRLPSAPGVYRMFNGDGDVLYVGKAKSLKNRVSNYSRMGGHTNRIAKMIQLTHAMEFVTTRSETEALLLEANLIKRLRPRFNVLLRDDKSFPYILITEDEEIPMLIKHRGARTRKGSYFGPFASASAVNRAINTLQKAFMLGTCGQTVEETGGRPCLNYQIKRCAGTCTGDMDKAAHLEMVEDAKAFLSGKSRAVKSKLAQEMEAAAESLEFERAARLRNRISALSQIQSHQGINPQGVEEADVFAVHQDGGQTCVQVFFYRTSQNWGNRSYFPRADASHSAAEVLGAFVSQFYDNKPVPKMVLLSEDIPERELLQEALELRAERRVLVNVPQRGEKLALVKDALSNARETLARKLAETSTQARLLKGLAETFELEDVPQRIEVFDNSHIMGTNPVGAMIVAGPEGFVKNQYRKFNIKSETITPGDDFGMMKEVMERRFKRLVKESGEKREKADPSDGKFSEWPDLLLIDGGLGQLNAVKSILEELGIADKIAMVGVAKGQDRDAGRERFFIPGKSDFSLPPRDPVLYFVQRLRDEAHRFAIGTHRARRKKEMIKNPLDEIDGIGPSRKRALLNNFGSAKGVSRATLQDLEKVEGISDAMAQMIYNHFRNG